MKKVLIFDGHNTFLRNFVVNPTSDTNGNPIGGLIGTLRSIKYMIHETKPSQVIFVWDGPGGARRRRGVMAEYKMGRKPRLNREMEEGTEESKNNVQWQMSKLKGLLGFLGVAQIEIPDIEADDTIGYLVGMLDPNPKVIVSGDRDMWQLVSETTTVYWPTKKVFITPGTFRENCPFPPENFVLARALSGKGDVSDNIQGIKGLGEKTLLKLFPVLGTQPTTLGFLLEECRGQVINGKKPLQGVKRWYQVILDHQDLVTRNVQVMQLTSPNISAQAGSVIRHAAEQEPSFNITGFKLALINNSIQLTDPDIFTVFQEYRLRVSREHQAA